MSPFGDASQRPDGSDEAMTRNGERAMNARQCSSNRLSCFFSERSLGGAIHFAQLLGILDDVHDRLRQ